MNLQKKYVVFNFNLAENNGEFDKCKIFDLGGLSISIFEEAFKIYLQLYC